MNFGESKTKRKTRFNAHFEGFYRLKGMDEWLNCYIYDVSETGAAIRVNQTLLEKDKLDIKIKSEETPVIEALVVNTSNQKVGVKFLTENSAEIIKVIIEDLYKNIKL